MLQRTLILFCVWILGSSQTYCQDFITWKTGDFFKAKVLEVGYTEIFYKKYENLDGPTYIILKSDIPTGRTYSCDCLFYNPSKRC